MIQNDVAQIMKYKIIILFLVFIKIKPFVSFIDIKIEYIHIFEWINSLRATFNRISVHLSSNGKISP